MHVFKHPKFYEELRRKRKQFQQEERKRNAKEQATSTKTQAASVKQQAIEESVPYTDIIEAAGDSDKPDS